jgi:O-antigen ligase
LIEKITFLVLFIYGISTPVSISATNLSLGIISLLFVYAVAKKRKIFYAPEGIPIIFLFFWRAISTFFYPIHSFKLGGKFWDHLPYFFIPNLSVKKTKTIIYATLFTATLISFMGILQAFFGFNYPFLPIQPLLNGEFIGLNFGFRMHSGGYYSIIAVFSLVFFCFLKANWKEKIFLFFCSLLNILVVILAQARTYYVALGIIIPLVFLKKGIRWFISGSFLIIFAVLVLSKFYLGLEKRFVSILDTKKTVSNLERFWMWRTSLKIIKKYPFTGIGFENWQEEVVKYWEKEKGEYPLAWTIAQLEKEGIEEKYILRPLQSHPHNSYLNVAVEDGLIGLTLFLLFWVGNLVQAFRRAKKSPKGSLRYTLNLGVGFSLIMLLIGSFFEYNLSTARLLLPITFLMGLSYLAVEE